MLHTWLSGLLLLSDALVVSPAVDSAEVYYTTRNFAAVVRYLEGRQDVHMHDKLLLGWSYYRLGRMERAKRAFQEGLQVAPESLELLNGLAFAHYRLGEAKDAEAAFRQVLARNPERLESLRGLAYVLFTSARFEECLPLFDGMLRGRPDETDLEYYIVKSVDGLLTAWQAQGKTPGQMVEEAWQHVAEGNRRSAVEMFRWVLQVDPFHPGARLGLGTLGPDFGYEKESRQALESLVRENPSDREARAALAQLHLNAGRRKEAEEQVARILSAAPDDPRGLALQRELARRGGRQR
jgi:tetratricopeptide (TPR) repeat protein